MNFQWLGRSHRFRDADKVLTALVAELHRLRPDRVIFSGDATALGFEAELARAADHVLHGPRGRAGQMNHGAAHATSDILLFLHADCTLETGALRVAEKCLGQRGVAAGCYRMTVTAPGLVYRLIDACATTADPLVRRCPRLRLLSTSRERWASAWMSSAGPPPLALGSVTGPLASGCWSHSNGPDMGSSL